MSSKKYKISHTTNYLYSNKVFFEPHYFRFKPKATTYSPIDEYVIKIEPKPVGMTEQIDIVNNHILFCWFENTHQNLKITVNSIVTVSDYNPLNFLVHPPQYPQLPFKYNKQTRHLLKASLKTDEFAKSIKEFLNELLNRANNNSISFLTELTRQIHNKFVLRKYDASKRVDSWRCLVIFNQRFKNIAYSLNQ